MLAFILGFVIGYAFGAYTDTIIEFCKKMYSDFKEKVS